MKAVNTKSRAGETFIFFGEKKKKGPQKNPNFFFPTASRDRTPVTKAGARVGRGRAF